MKPPSSRIKNIANTGGREVLKMGSDVHYMGAGTIQFDTFEHIHQAAIRAIEADYVGYTDNVGMLSLREAIAEKLANENHVHYSPDEILVTSGSSEILSAIPHAFMEPGDEAIMFSPHYVGHFAAVVELASGVPVILPTSGDNNWQPDLAMVEAAITPRTKLLFMVSPSNPVGSALSAESVHGLCEIAIRHDLYVIADELYERIMFDGKKVLSPGSLPGMRERTFTINGFSKAYGMTGWRVGYMGAPRELLKPVHRARLYVGICAPSISQHAALAALTGPQEPMAAMLAELDRRRQFMCSRLDAIDGIRAPMQDGTFYSFIDVREFMREKGDAVRAVLTAEVEGYEVPESISQQFTDFMVVRGRVYLSPGVGFGDSGEGWFRISGADYLPHLQKGIERIEAAASSI
jgi:aspartate/methionine/tyrosine aminotransferase